MNVFFHPQVHPPPPPTHLTYTPLVIHPYHTHTYHHTYPCPHANPPSPSLPPLSSLPSPPPSLSLRSSTTWPKALSTSPLPLLTPSLTPSSSPSLPPSRSSTTWPKALSTSHHTISPISLPQPSLFSPPPMNRLVPPLTPINQIINNMAEGFVNLSPSPPHPLPHPFLLPPPPSPLDHQQHGRRLCQPLHEQKESSGDIRMRGVTVSRPNLRDGESRSESLHSTYDREFIEFEFVP